MELLSEQFKLTQIQAGLADGQSDPNSSRVDMAGYDGVLFLCGIGTITGSGTVLMTAKQAATDIAGDALSGATAQADTSTDGDKVLMIDIFRPKDRYLGVTLTRAVANSVIGGVWALQYRSQDKRPLTQDSSSLAASLVKLVSPAEA